VKRIRSLIVIDPEKKVSAIVNYSSSTGRNFHELLRLIDALHATHAHQNISTPADWKVGEDVLVNPDSNAVAGEEAVAAKVDVRIFELPSGKDYMMYAKDPSVK
jgi:alkyl hydroperoxide reductase subunit AhpC